MSYEILLTWSGEGAGREMCWPNGAQPSMGLLARVEHLVTWTCGFVARFRGVELHAITVVAQGEPPVLEVLLVRDDVAGADDEQGAARAAEAALLREMPALAEGVRFRGEYCK